MGKKRTVLMALVLVLLAMPVHSFGYEILESYDMGPVLARGLAFDELNGTLWVVGNGTLDEYDPVTMTMLSSITVNPDFSGFLTGLSFNRSTGNLWVVDQGTSTVHEVDRAGDSVRTFNGQYGLAFENDCRLWCGPGNGSGQLVGTDTCNGETIGLASPVAGSYSGLAFDHGSNALWVAVRTGWPGPAYLVKLDSLQENPHGGLYSDFTIEQFVDPTYPEFYLNGLAFDSDKKELWIVSEPVFGGGTFIHRLSMECTVDGGTCPNPTGDMGYHPSINNSGEIVRYQDRQIHSNMRGQLTFDTDWKSDLDMNNNGDVVWLQLGLSDTGSRTAQIYLLKYEDATPTQITSSRFSKAWPAINDLGQIIWYESGQIFSYIEGGGVIQLTDGPGLKATPDINNLGDIVWSQEDSATGNHQIVGIFDGEQTLISSGPDVRHSTAINDDREVVWTQYPPEPEDPNDPIYRPARIYSNTRGMLGARCCLKADDHSSPDINDNGDVVFVMSTSIGQEIFVLEGAIEDKDSDGYNVNEDCNDDDGDIFPGNAEACDGKDNDCNGHVDDGLTVDADGDGHSSIGSCGGTGDDCNDGNGNVFPGNAEACDLIDNNCDGNVDEGLTFDADGDGYSSIGSCGGTGDDCNDAEVTVNPYADEVCNGRDDDCDDRIDEGDGDGDGIEDCVDSCPAEDATGFDVDMDGCIDTMDGLSGMVEVLAAQGVIAEEMQNSFLTKVDNATKSVNKDNVCAALHKLEALLNEVNAQRGKKIAEEAAVEAIAYTQNIITYLQSLLPAGEGC